MAKTELVMKGGFANPSLFYVSVNGEVIGMIEKRKDRPLEKFPWKAYKGLGKKAELVGEFMEGESAAVNAIVG